MSHANAVNAHLAKGLSLALCLSGLLAWPLTAQTTRPGRQTRTAQADEQWRDLANAGRTAEALKLVAAELKARQAALGNDHPDVATLLAELGRLRRRLGQSADAKTSFTEVVRIRRITAGNDHPLTSVALSELGMVVKDLGDFPAAKALYDEALAIEEKLPEPAGPRTAALLNNLGLLLHEQGDDAAARPLLERALAIIKKTRGDKHEDTADVLMSLGLVMAALEDPQAAKSLIEQATSIRLDVLGKDHPIMGATLNNYGTALISTGELENAAKVLEFARQVQTQRFGAAHPEVATVLNNRAFLLNQSGDAAAARRDLEEALRIRTNALGENHPDTASSLSSLSALLLNLGDYDAARPMLKRSIAVQRQLLGDDHPSTIGSLYSLVISEIGSGDFAAGLATADQSRRAARRYVARTLPNLSEREQLAWITVVDHAPFHGALTLGGSLREAPGALDLGAGWVLNGKALTTAALGERNLLLREARDDKSRALVTQLLDVRQKLVSAALSAASPGGQAVRQKLIATLTAQEQKLSREFSTLSGRNASAADPWVELADVRAALEPDEVLIEIARHDVVNLSTETGAETPWLPARYSAWVIPPAGDLPVQFVDLGPADLVEALLAEIRKSLSETTKTDSILRLQGEAAAVESLDAPLKRARETLWDPLSRALPRSTKKLVLSPDGDLWLFPWAMVPGPNGRLLIEDYSIRLVTSGRDITRQPSDSDGTTAPLQFADPDFDLTGERVLQSLKSLLPDFILADEHAVRSVTPQAGLPAAERLPNTRLEAQVVAPNIEKLTGLKPRSFADDSALETVLKQAERPRMVMISTHGFFLSGQTSKPGSAPTSARPVTPTTDIENPLVRCGLLFAGCNSTRRTAADDGVLTGLEIVGLNLRGTSLVVLSACETGLGKVHNGEGVAGLRQAFQLAGAEAVVSTLWQVPDRDSALLMNDFFANLAKGESKAEALRQAQLARIEARRSRYGAAHPFFWAAWTVTGK